jgi:hemerythrin-like metal-binding protein
MEKIVWNDEFSVGVETMDVQHQRILKIYNKLIDNAQADPSSETVSEVLTEMVEYASTHFKSEEQLLEDHEYPELKQQKAEHREFKRQAGEFCLLTLEQDEKVIHDLLNYLHDWWKDHVLYKDKRYAAFFEEKRSLSRKDKGLTGKLPNN